MTYRGKARPPPRYCGNCGAQVGQGDRFCGVCGNRIAPVTPEDPQVIPEPVVAAQGAATRGRRRSLALVSAVGIVLVLLVGGGALAFVGLGLGFGSVSPDAPPDPAFALPLQALRNQTEAPIMLPAELPDELKNVAVDEDLEGDRYGILFKDTPPDELVEPFVRATTVATLTAVPQSESEPNDLFKVTSTESVQLPDGTEAQLRHMEPVGEVVNYGPYWEGTFDKGGYTYTLSDFLGHDGK